MVMVSCVDGLIYTVRDLYIQFVTQHKTPRDTYKNTHDTMVMVSCVDVQICTVRDLYTQFVKQNKTQKDTYKKTHDTMLMVSCVNGPLYIHKRAI